jgi:hypothetical protein
MTEVPIKWLAAAVGLLIISGTACPADAADGDNRPVGVSTLIIVPLESPPLSVNAGLSFGGALGMNTGIGLTYVGDATAASAGRALILVSGIAMLATLPEQARQAATASTEAESLLNSRVAWQPTVALASTAQALLTEAGVGNVQVSEEIRPIPGVQNRTRTFTMHNWYGPVKDWYALDSSPFTYTPPEVPADARVLEVGLGNYELSNGMLFVYVNTKLVDPVTGRTIAKARKYVYPDPGDLDALFAGDASGFKRAFIDAARPALRDDLRRIGLLPR